MAKPGPDPLDVADPRRPGDRTTDLVRAIARLGADRSVDRDARLVRITETLRESLRADTVELWIATRPFRFTRIGSEPADTVEGDEATRWKARLSSDRAGLAMVPGHATALDVAVLGSDGVLGALRCERRHASRDWSTSDRALAATAADRIAVTLEAEAAQPCRSDARELMRLVQGVAHDLGNTLTTALGHVQLASHACGDAAPTGSARDAIEALDFACRLTRQLRDLGDDSTCTFTRLALGEIVLGIDGLLRAVAGAGRRLEMEFAPATGAVRGDPGALARMLLNLVANARDATSDGGVITIGTRTSDTSLELFVRDDGAGVTAEVRRHMFDPGFTTKADQGGSGLGLAAVRAIAESHGATIVVESAPGAGTTIAIRFPRAD